MRIWSGSSRAVALTTALALSAWPPAWAQTAESQGSPTFRSGIELVSIDVGVVDRQGRPVPGLQAGDFTVSVGGERRRVVSAEFVDLSSSRAGAARAGLAPVSTNEAAGVGRQFVFIVDQSTLEPGHVRYVAKAASGFLAGLSFVDRSALMLMPTGPHIDFTWAHERIGDALLRVTGLASQLSMYEFGSLSEARDIAARNPIALRNVAQRECGGSLSASAGGFDPFGSGPGGGGTFGGGGGGGGGAGPGQGPGASAGGGGSEGGGDAGGAGQGGVGGGTGGGGGGRGGGGGGGSAPAPRGTPGGSRMDSCTRDIQMRAELAWRSAHMTSLSSVASLRHVLDVLQQVPGDKTVVLISGGWPLEEREQMSLLSMVADQAAAARATVFTMFVPPAHSSAGRRTVSLTPVADEQVGSWPLEVLAGMTGGGFFRADVGAEGAFGRLSRELASYYRLAVEKGPADREGSSRRLKVEVSRRGATVRARSVFDSRTFQDRNWAARLGAALEAPIPATAVGLRVTSYLTWDTEDPRRVKLVLTGEASRVEPGDATVQVLVRDLEGKKLSAGEQPLGEPTGDALAFTANVPIQPGRYVVRVAVIDGAGRTGSVDHRVDAHPVPIGSFSATPPVLIRVPTGAGAEPRLAIDALRQDERLAVQVELEGSSRRAADTQVAFEILPASGGPAAVTTSAELVAGGREGTFLAQAFTDLRTLPPGEYHVRARLSEAGATLGEVRRGFRLLEAPHVTAGVSAPAAHLLRGAPAVPPSLRAFARIPAFGVDQVLAPDVRGPFLDRVAARPDAASPMIRDLIDQARSDGIQNLFISDTLAAEYPVAAFLKGLSLLARRNLEGAAGAFRSAMRGSADFYQAMVYLGACYAAGGNDKEATGAWRTALIKEGDTAALHLLIGEAFLRQARSDLALETLASARARWPEDPALTRRFVVAAAQAGAAGDALSALEELVEEGAADEPSLAAGLLLLHQAFNDGRPVEGIEEDRSRMQRFGEAYRALDGPSLALIETWLEAAGSSR